MRVLLAFGLIVLGFTVGYFLRPDTASVAVEKPVVPRPASEGPAAETPLPALRREAEIVKPIPAESRTETTFISRPDWREDKALLESITATFRSTFDEQVHLSTIGAEDRLTGDKQLRWEIGRSGGTEPGLQVQENDFSTLPQNQTALLGHVLQNCTKMSEEYGTSIQAGMDPEAERSLRDHLDRQSLFSPPELVLDHLGIKGKLQHPEFAAEVRSLRAEMMRRAAPSLTLLDYYQRFALGAAMQNGISPMEFDERVDARWIAPRVMELELEIEALCRESCERSKALAEGY